MKVLSSLTSLAMSHAAIARGVGGTLLILGGAGLASGYGGQFFFALPVVEYVPPGGATAWGTPRWSYPAMSTGQGEWADFWATAWALSGLSSSDFPAPDFDGSLDAWFQANVKEGWGVELDYVGTISGAIGTPGQIKWGPLGPYGGFLMLGSMGLGLGLMLAANRL